MLSQYVSTKKKRVDKNHCNFKDTYSRKIKDIILKQQLYMSEQRPVKKFPARVDETAWLGQVAFAIKSDDLSLIPENHMIEEN